MKHIFHGSSISNLKTIKANISYSYPDLKQIVFGTYNKIFASIFGYPWRDDLFSVTTRDAIKKPINFPIEITIRKPISKDLLSKPFSIYQLSSKDFIQLKNHPCEYYHKGDVKVLLEESYPDYLEYIIKQPLITIKNINNIRGHKTMTISIPSLNIQQPNIVLSQEEYQQFISEQEDTPLNIQPSTPEDDDNKKELEPYIPNINEQSELLNELDQLSDHDTNILIFQTLSEIDHQKRHLHYIISCLKRNDTQIAEEGFFEHPFVSLRNLAGSLISKFKVLFVLSLRDLKRSELRALKDSNSGSYAEILKKELYDLQNISLPYPTGMEKITYFEALNRIQIFYNSIHMKDLSININKNITDLIKFINTSDLTKLSQDSTVKTKFNDLTTLKKLIDISLMKRVFLPLLDINKDVISTAKQIETKNEKLFVSLFKSANEFRDVLKTALKLEDRLKEVSSIYSNLQNIQSSIDKFVTSLEEKSNVIHKEYIVVLASYIEQIGEIFDMFSQGVYQHTRVDHNLVEVLKVLFHHFKY
jgi:hypothetical protein